MIFRNRFNRIVPIIFILLALYLSFAIDITSVSGATITVNTTADEELNDSFCSLREALWAARFDTAYYGCNAGFGADIVTLPSGTYTLSKALTYIYTEITINGEDPSTTIIEASDCNPVAETCEHDYNVFTVWDSGNLTLNNLTIRHGNGANNGGGILNYFSGNLIINNCIFTENKGRQGGGVLNHGDSTLSISDSTFMQNETSANTTGNGGAIFNQGDLIISNSTLSSNFAYVFGGGIYNSGSLTLTNSTLSSNAAESNGGGIYNYEGTVTLTNSTLSENRGYSSGGIYNRSGATLNLTNVIIANSILEEPGNDCANYGTISTNISNLVEDGSCNATYSDDPLLGSLADNGGATETHALLMGSPAIDAGSLAECPATDQRGVTRPKGSGCDIGAYEYEQEFMNYIPLILKY
jgi:CSLREA domain-containing protein